MKNLVRVSICAIAISIFGGMAVDAQNITTVAGGGPPATTTIGVTQLTTSIGAPAAVRQDHSGNTYILDNDLGRVFKVDTSGNDEVTVLAHAFNYRGGNSETAPGAAEGAHRRTGPVDGQL